MRWVFMSLPSGALVLAETLTFEYAAELECVTSGGVRIPKYHGQAGKLQVQETDAHVISNSLSCMNVLLLNSWKVVINRSLARGLRRSCLSTLVAQPLVARLSPRLSPCLSVSVLCVTSKHSCTKCR
jgi:hypothetical protein